METQSGEAEAQGTGSVSNYRAVNVNEQLGEEREGHQMRSTDLKLRKEKFTPDTEKIIVA